jgi:hypothetical protein
MFFRNAGVYVSVYTVSPENLEKLKSHANLLLFSWFLVRRSQYQNYTASEGIWKDLVAV